MKKYLFSIFCIIAAVIIGAISYPYLPEQIAVHWGPGGDADGFSTKLHGLLIFPFTMLMILIIKYFIPKIDPKKQNYQQFSKPYHLTMDFVVAFMLVIYISSILYNLDFPVDILFVITLSMGILFMFIGNYLPKVKHNYFMGIRTPWTLSNENVWIKTHRFGGKAFVLSGILMIALLFTSAPPVYVVLTPILCAVLSTTLMSYIYFEKEKQ